MTQALQLVAALAVTLGVMLVTLRFLQRARNGGVARVPLRVLQRVETGPRQAIALVQVVDRVLVVSLAEGGTRMLTELDEAARAQVLTTVPTAPNAPKVDVRLGSGAGALQMSGTVGLVVFMGFLTLLPAIVLLMTSFTRILIVLHFLRSALGTQTTPPSQLLAAIAILLTAVIMNPVLQRTQQEALNPYFEGRITQVEAYNRGIVPFREFMLTHTREKDLAMFAEASGVSANATAEQMPIVSIISAFVTSELRTAFQMGFALFLPFVVVDVVVASVLMSLGMFMLPPAMISLPFKLLLFVLADGWSLVFQNLIASFR